MEMELTLSELKDLIKEGVEKLHRKTLIENRINQINKELDDLEKIPLDRVIKTLEKYDLEMGDVSDEGDSEDDGWLSIEDLANRGLLEKAPSAGLSAKQKSNIVKKAKAGEDIGHKGKGFKDVVAKAKASGAEDPEAVAAAAMWKNVKRK